MSQRLQPRRGMKCERLIPSGGTSGQVLAKSSNADYAAGWVTPEAGEGGAHTHEIDDVTGLQTALDGKQAAGSYETADPAIQAHLADPHAPADAQKNSDITKAEIEAVLTGEIDSHSHAGGGGSGPDVKSGLVSLTAGGSAVVAFASAFSSTPQVVVLSQINNADTSCTYSAHTVSTGGFTLRGAGNPAGNVAWIATNAGNS